MAKGGRDQGCSGNDEVREMRNADTVLGIIRACHVAITHGVPRWHAKRSAPGPGEPGAVKAACPVRRGAVGKGPAITPP